MNSKSFLKTTILIYTAVFMGMALFALVVFFIKKDKYFNLSETNNMFYFVVPILAISGVIGSQVLFKNGLVKIQNANGLDEKMKLFNANTLVSYALIEGPFLFSAIAFFLSGNLFFLYVGGIILFYFLTKKPTKENIIQQLNLNNDELKEFEGNF